MPESAKQGATGLAEGSDIGLGAGRSPFELENAMSAIP